MDIKIYMIDYADGEGYNEGGVRLRLDEMFNRVCRDNASTATSADIHWIVAHCPFVRTHDLLVYILRSPKHSVIKRVYKEKIDTGDAGNTYTGGSKGAISEVYVNHPINTNEEGLANMIFHELMHNKLEIDSDMHFKCSPVGGEDIAQGSHRYDAAPMGKWTKLTECDIKLMAPALGNVAPQYSEQKSGKGLRFALDHLTPAPRISPIWFGFYCALGAVTFALGRIGQCKSD